MFGVCLTSDARFVVSVSNKFLIWDLSTSDLTRAVNPGVEGVFQGLVLSPDDRFAAAWTNNSQTILLNLLTSEQVVIDNPLLPETVKGARLLDTHVVLYGQSRWKMMTLQGAELESHTETCGLAGFQLLSMDFAGSADHFRVIFWTGELDDKRLALVNADNHGRRSDPLQLHSALVMNRKRNVLYACADCNMPDVSIFKLAGSGDDEDDDSNNGNRKGTLHRQDRVSIDDANSSAPPPDGTGWIKMGALPAGEPLLQLGLSENESHLLGTSALGFCIWDLAVTGSGEIKRTDLKLPMGVRNISVRLLHSNSVMLSKGNEYAVAGVRKNLYVWNMASGDLVKVLDAHFGRILSIVPYTVGPWNSVVTSSIDRSVKVWNLNNVFEQVHVIDRHELQIDSIR